MPHSHFPLPPSHFLLPTSSSPLPPSQFLRPGAHLHPNPTKPHGELGSDHTYIHTCMHAYMHQVLTSTHTLPRGMASLDLDHVHLPRLASLQASCCERLSTLQLSLPSLTRSRARGLEPHIHTYMHTCYMHTYIHTYMLVSSGWHGVRGRARRFLPVCLIRRDSTRHDLP